MEVKYLKMNFLKDTGSTAAKHKLSSVSLIIHGGRKKLDHF